MGRIKQISTYLSNPKSTKNVFKPHENNGRMWIPYLCLVAGVDGGPLDELKGGGNQ